MIAPASLWWLVVAPCLALVGWDMEPFSCDAILIFRSSGMRIKRLLIV